MTEQNPRKCCHEFETSYCGDCGKPYLQICHKTYDLLVTQNERLREKSMLNALNQLRDEYYKLKESSDRMLEALNSIAAWHLSEDKIRACGGDAVLTDTQIAREAIIEYRKEFPE